MLAGPALHIGEHGRQQCAAAAGQIDRFVPAPDFGVRPVLPAAGVEGQPRGERGGDWPGEERAIRRLVAHDAVEQRPGVVGAHVGVGFGDALGFGGEVMQGALQAGGLARRLNGVDGLQRGFEHRAEVVAHDALPFAGHLPHDIGLVLDQREVADARQPAAVADSLVQHRGVHQQQRGDGAAVGLLFISLLEPVKLEVGIKRGQQSVGPQMVGRFANARFEYVQIAHHPVFAQPGLRQQVHFDGAAVVFEAAQLEHELALFLGAFLGGFAGFALLAGRDANAALAGVDHLAGFGLGFLYVHYAPGLSRFGLVAGHGISAKFNRPIMIFLSC